MILGGSLLALGQDLVVAYQGLALIEFSRLATKKYAFVPGLLYFLGVNGFLLFDAALHYLTKIRMDFAFFNFLSVLHAFSSSMQESGTIVGLIAVPLGLLLVSYAIGRPFQKLVSRMQVPKVTWLGLLPALVLAWFSWSVVPTGVSYLNANAWFSNQWLQAKYYVESGGSEGNQETLALLKSSTENAEYLNPDYPLLKRSLGFQGELTFDWELAQGEKPNVVILFMESFRAKDVGVLGGEHKATPHFDQLAGESVLFERFYGNGIQTARASVATTFGILPRFTKLPAINDIELPLIGLADIFQERGYSTATIKTGHLAFDNFGSFLVNHGFQEAKGYPDLLKHMPGALGSSWGLHDEYLYQYLLDWLEKQEKPSFVMAYTLTNHHPWQPPQTYQAPQFAVDPRSEYAEFLKSYSYADQALGHFIEQLKERGLHKNLILIVLADTGQPMMEHGYRWEFNHLFEEHVHIPALIWAPDYLKKPTRVRALGSQVDILPTLLDLLGWESVVHHSIGESLRRRSERTVYLNNPMSQQYVGILEDQWKYISGLKTGESLLFDLSQDPSESRNRSEQDESLARELRGKTLSVNQLFSRLYLSHKFAPRRDD